MAVASHRTGKYYDFPKKPELIKIVNFLDAKGFDNYDGDGIGMVKDANNTGKRYYRLGECNYNLRSWWVTFTDGKVKYFIRCPETGDEWYDSYRKSMPPRMSEPTKFGSFDAIRRDINDYFNW